MTSPYIPDVATSPYTILIIEDEPEIIMLNEIALKRGGYNVISAKNGKIGVEMAIEHLPDLIVCDIMMPEMDGYGVLERLRKNSQTATIPFIFLTARSSMEDFKEGMLRGADGYLVKPVLPDQLVSNVKERLGRAHLLRGQRLHEFAQRIVRMQARERQRIAHNLQAEVYQPLLSLEFLLRLRDDSLKVSNSPSATDVNGDLTPLLRQAISNMERLIQDLHPTTLDHIGLAATLRSLIEKYDHLAIQLEMNNLNRSFQEETKLVVFRVVQEALTNIEKHARVQRASLVVSYEDDALNIQIHDKGVGFDVEASLNDPRNVGLMSMYEQVISVNGEMQIVSAQDAGTRIDIRLPQGDAPSIPFYQEYDEALSKAIHQNAPGRATSGTNTELRVNIAIALPNIHLVSGMNRLLAYSPNYKVIREISSLTPQDVLAAIKEAQPDVLIINPFFGERSHTDIVQAVAEQAPRTHILVVSPFTSREYVVDAFQHGAKGYVPLNTTRVDLLTAVSNVVRGKPYLSPTIPDPGRDFTS